MSSNVRINLRYPLTTTPTTGVTLSVQLDPINDQSVGSWLTQTGAAASLWASIDDYVGGGAQDGDTTYVVGPNKVNNNGVSFVLSSAFVDPARITAFTIKTTARKESAGVSGPADQIGLQFSILSPSFVALTNTVTLANIGAAYVETTSAFTLSGSPTADDFSNPILNVNQTYSQQGPADTTARARLSAVAVFITYSVD